MNRYAGFVSCCFCVTAVVVLGCGAASDAGNPSGGAGGSGGKGAAGGSGAGNGSVGTTSGSIASGGSFGMGGSQGASGASAGGSNVGQGGSAGLGGSNDRGTGGGPTEAGIVDGSGGKSEGGLVESGAGNVDGSLTDGSAPLRSDSGDAGGAGLSFFVSSTGSGAMGGDLGGLPGADSKCQSLATAAGAGNRTWHAYLSVSGATPIHARDRIGGGPWYNVRGVKMADTVAQLHEEGGARNAFSFQNTLDEKGNTIRFANPDEHDILTGSGLDGRALPAVPDRTCAGWTASTGSTAQVGHTDRQGLGENPTSWNSAHSTPSCAAAQLAGAGGIGRIYCFAL